jgi:hypothetical protein
LEKLPQQIHVEVANPTSRVVHSIVQTRPAGQIDHRPRQGLIQRHIGVTVTSQPTFIADSLVQRLAQHDAHILNHVVRVDLKVAGSFHVNIDHAVSRNLRQHMIKKWQASSKVAGAIAI